MTLDKLPEESMKPVWIVDDDKSIRWVLEKTLAREKIAFQSFASATEALAQLDAGGRSTTGAGFRHPHAGSVGTRIAAACSRNASRPCR
jgi:DNA-binding NtrC family response regulator